jgi:hypothetical protein
LRLAEHLAQLTRQNLPTAAPRRKWEDLIGLLPYPALGEDAQAYISRTRREGDAHREQVLRGKA